MLQAQLKVNVVTAAVDAMNTKSGEYEKSQKEQMYDGIASDNRMISPPYAPQTIKIKKFKGQPTDRVTLKDTGNFYAGIFTDKRADGFIIDSKDSKANELQEKYGEEIFGLADYKKQPFIDIVRPVFIGSIEQQLNNRQ